MEAYAMAGNTSPQSKARTLVEQKVEDAARAFLNEVLPQSCNGTPTEYGGIIWVRGATGEVGQKGPLHEPGNSVSIRQWEPNMGCPDGTTPMAWYHTHPHYPRPEKGLTYAYKDFIGNDKNISDDYRITGYLGVIDGSFWRYDPPSRGGGPKGSFVRLNGKLKTTLP
jgi:hypothetical protein